MKKQYFYIKKTYFYNRYYINRAKDIYNAVELNKTVKIPVYALHSMNISGYFKRSYNPRPIR